MVRTPHHLDNGRSNGRRRRIDRTESLDLQPRGREAARRPEPAELGQRERLHRPDRNRVPGLSQRVVARGRRRRHGHTLARDPGRGLPVLPPPTFQQGLVSTTYLSTCAEQPKQDRRHDVSRDPHVHVLLQHVILSTARILVTPFIMILILTPVVLCNYLANPTARMVSVAIATTTFIAVLSGSTKARTVELVVAGATWVHSSYYINSRSSRLLLTCRFHADTSQFSLHLFLEPASPRIYAGS